jgi:hypothetical protein
VASVAPAVPEAPVVRRRAVSAPVALAARAAPAALGAPAVPTVRRAAQAE